MTRERFLMSLISMGNVPYIWGGEDVRRGPNGGVDCSGLSQAILRLRNQDPPGDDTADMLRKRLVEAGGKVIDIKDATLGDQVFYGDGKRATHIATYLMDGMCFGANGGGSKFTTQEYARKNGGYTKVQPWDYRPDFMCCIRPAGGAW